MLSNAIKPVAVLPCRPNFSKAPSSAIFFFGITRFQKHSCESSSHHYQTADPLIRTVSDRPIMSACSVPIPMKNQTARSHGGLSSRSDNHSWSAPLACPAQSLWLLGLKKIPSHCRPDLTQQPQQGLVQIGSCCCSAPRLQAAVVPSEEHIPVPAAHEQWFNRLESRQSRRSEVRHTRIIRVHPITLTWLVINLGQV